MGIVYYSEIWNCWQEGINDFVGITHWMPLPELPK